jgi:DNA modification methylase
MIKKISEIVLNDNRRKVDESKVKELAESIKQLGLINPITVNSNNVLIAGNHRLEAFKLLGKDEIEVSVLDLNNLLAELAEIDENLVRNELHWTDADKQIARRKIIYLELYPETKKGAVNQHTKDVLNPKFGISNKSFAQDTADKTNKSKSSISQSVKRGNEITEQEAEVLKTIDAPKSYGDILIKQTTETRAKVIDALKVESKPVEIIIQEIKKEEKKINFEQKKAEFEKPIEIINTNQIIILGDSKEILPTLKLKTFDLLLSDPPYGMDFKSGWNDKEKIANDKIEDTITLFENVLKECVPLLKDDAHFYLFGNIDFLPEIKPIIEKYLNLKNILIWDRKVIGMGDLKTYGFSYDIVYFGYNKKWKDLNGTRDRDILQFNRVTPSANIHPTEKPIDLLEYLIKKSTKENDNILDPFAGGGSTLLSCKNTNRLATGIEIEEKYYNLIKSRI